MSTVVIINPESASGATRKAWPGIASDLASAIGPFKPLFTEGAGQARDLAMDAARTGAKLIVACGGDGTVSEVANGILLSGKDSELGVLPSGIGGDFRRTIGVSLRPREAARVLKDGLTRTIDVGRVTFTTSTGNQD